MNPYELLKNQCSLQTIIPLELWEYIFSYKWRLDHRNLSLIMKDIHEELIPKNDLIYKTTICTSYKNPGNKYEEEVQREYNKLNKKYRIGNYWYKITSYMDRWEWGFMKKTYSIVKVNEKCGIELLNWTDAKIHTYGMKSFPIFCSKKTLYYHLTENVGIVCSEKVNYNDMMKLLRTV